jgi:hypothetical protein
VAGGGCGWGAAGGGAGWQRQQSSNPAGSSQTPIRLPAPTHPRPCAPPLTPQELHALLERPSLDGIPLLVLGNKNDLPGALTTEQLISRMDLEVGGGEAGRGGARSAGQGVQLVNARPETG